VEVRSQDASGIQRLDIAASVKIANTVYLGKDGGKQCGTQVAAELSKDYYRADLTYCFEVTSTGLSYLGSVFVEGTDLVFVDKSIGMMAPGATAPLFSKCQYFNTVYLGNDNEYRIALCRALQRLCRDILPQSHNQWKFLIENVVGDLNASVTYCLTVTNTGETNINQVTVTDAELGITDNSIGQLAPGQSKLLSFPKMIAANSTNNAACAC